MDLKLLPIRKKLEDNREFLSNPDCAVSLSMSVDYYNGIGYEIPWIGYFVSLDKILVGQGGFKGKPVDGRVEIAYGTVERFQNKGIGSEICKTLVRLALKTDPTVRVCARTLMEENFSVKLLRKNGFECQGPVIDQDDGEVWEWEFKKKNLSRKLPAE